MAAVKLFHAISQRLFMLLKAILPVCHGPLSNKSLLTMRHGKKAVDNSACKVIPLITKQETCRREMVCRDCNWSGEMLLPSSMKSQHVECPGCEIAGYMIGWRKR